MQEQRMNDNDSDPIHELWLIYCKLKDAETDPATREPLISSARAQLGTVLSALNHYHFEPKSPGIQAANLNCRHRALTHRKPNFLQGYCLSKNLTSSSPERGGNNGGKDESKVTIGAIGAGPATVREGGLEGKG
jgi:hypothetical protein